jgi:limonene 1,2-monooxygenase
MALPERLRFGTFTGPFHRVGENPTSALERDIELIQAIDRLGFDEAWIGEHHSAGWETIASPEVFIATVAERTTNIKLGTGVISVPYHHPLMIANRMVLLDHLTRGRAMMGVGPGVLLSDARMLGIDPADQRRRLDEGLGAIMQLLTSREPVNVETDWFTLKDAVAHLRPYTTPHFPIAVAGTVSPTGATLAGKYGVRLLSNVQAGTTVPDLARQWAIAEETAAANGNSVDRNEWRLLIIAHVAETRKEALEQARKGAIDFPHEYHELILGADPVVDGGPNRILDHMVGEGLWCVGTPDDLIARIHELDERTGGFGCLLAFFGELGAKEDTRRSFELIARYVMPQFQGSLDNLQLSSEVAADHKAEFSEQRKRAVQKAGGEIARGD